MWCHMVPLEGSGPQPEAREMVNARAKMSALGRWQYCYKKSRKASQTEKQINTQMHGGQARVDSEIIIVTGISKN